MINIDYSRNELLSDFAIRTLKGGYLLEGEDPQEGFARAAQAFATDDNHAQRIYDYASKHWFMFSTPILSNAGRKDGLPISCYLNHVDDSRRGILEHYVENGWLSSNGGGIGANWSQLRSDGERTSKGGRSTGVIPFLKVADSSTLAFSQGTSRRGSYAAYMDISHPEIEEFILTRRPTGGDLRRKCMDIDHGVNIPDTFMYAVENDWSWYLIDPHSKAIKKIVKARYLWELILTTRLTDGEPFIHWIDTSNDAIAPLQKEKGLKIHHSNLCTEILLPTDKDRTAVCCLSSVNVSYYDEWKNDKIFIRDIIEFLDNVLTFFEEHASHTFDKARNSVEQERAIGLGVMGFHDYMQKQGFSLDTIAAHELNTDIFFHISWEAIAASRVLAKLRGKAPESEELRNTYLLAIAPNASSSIICGNTSPGIEPYRANAFTQKTAYGSNLFRNPNLKRVLEWHKKNTEEVWNSIVQNKGSVQHLEFLTLDERDVFKTAMEINQMDLIYMAADRQEYICQGQSLNLFFPPDVNIKEYNKVHMNAWRAGLKTLYYVRSESARHVETIPTVQQCKIDDPGCTACE